MENQIAQYFSDKPEVAAVYLFGSQADKKARPFSDVDIAVLVKTGSEELVDRKRVEYLVELGRLLRKDIHPVIMNQLDEEVLRRIFSTGTCVLVNDQDALTRFKTASFVKIAEFGYYRRQLQKGVIRKVREKSQSG